MTKKIFSIIAAFMLSVLTIYLISYDIKKEVLPLGTDLPTINFKGIYGHSIIQLQKKPVIIIYFSTVCEHCRYQLNLFNSHITRLTETDIYFLTSESDFFIKSSGKEWEELSGAPNATFGIIDKDSFRELFGFVATPSLFFFNKQGILKEKIRGEVKLQKILKILQNLTSGQTQSAAIINVL